MITSIDIISKNNRSNLNNILGKTSAVAICNYGKLKDKEKCPEDRVGSTATNISIWKIHSNEK